MKCNFGAYGIHFLVVVLLSILSVSCSKNDQPASQDAPVVVDNTAADSVSFIVIGDWGNNIVLLIKIIQ